MIGITKRIVGFYVNQREDLERRQADRLTCPECDGQLIKHDGCEQCPSCGYAKCSL